MIINKNLSKHIVFAEDDLLNALRKISGNASRLVFAVSESGILEGVLTDGDFRRWLLNQADINLNRPVSEVMNRTYEFADINDPIESLRGRLSKKIEYLPLVDRYHHLVAIASERFRGIEIAGTAIGDAAPVFVIAEIGNNHNGSLERAFRLIDRAVEAGANCAKFQMRHLLSLYRNAGNANDASEDLGSQYTLDLLSRFQLSNEQMFEAFDYCKRRKIIPLCTPWDIESLQVLEGYGLAAYKVASADLTNHELLEALSKTKKPILCSTGMSSEAEIIESVSLLKRAGAMFVLLHCNSTYPTPFKDVNLAYLDRLKEIGNCPVGYSGHERGFAVPIAAVARGAKVIEKHLTEDRSLEGNDHKISLLPDEFLAMVRSIRETEEALGRSKERLSSQGELMNRQVLAKSLVIECDLKTGETIEERMILVRSPGKGLQPNRKKDLIGRKAPRDFKAGDFFFESDLAEQVAVARKYQFKRPWGIPVRYHDYQRMMSGTNPDLLEFHLSYKDMDLRIEDFFSQTFHLGLVVHSPELFAGDHVLDLGSSDAAYRRRSVQELGRVCEITRRLNPYFPKQNRPCIVTNAGGFSADRALPKESRADLYTLVADSLQRVASDGVEIIPQTMPPYPWHFGGQRFHNLFVEAPEIVDFCEKHGMRICLDVSHSKLACAQLGRSFREFIRMVGPYVAHLHIADTAGVDGEGLQIGKGEMDFVMLGEDLRQYASEAGFIPEIWQGHINDGEGFWIALEQLEKSF